VLGLLTQCGKAGDGTRGRLSATRFPWAAWLLLGLVSAFSPVLGLTVIGNGGPINDAIGGTFVAFGLLAAATFVWAVLDWAASGREL
jgi:hypothetical protein